MSQDYHVIIPARFQSTRLPGKLLLKLGNQSVLERVYQQACKAQPASVVIATDSEEIARHAREFGAIVEMTAAHHLTGSDRLAEVVKTRGYASDAIIVNVQGDEPFIPPALITQTAQLLKDSDAPVSTLCWPVESLLQLNNPNVVKVVRNCFDEALYFSRSPIPAHRDNPEDISASARHIGIYGYRAGFLLDYVSWPECEIEHCEALEMLRILWQGYKILVGNALILPPQDINTQEDFVKAALLISTLDEA